MKMPLTPCPTCHGKGAVVDYEQLSRDRKVWLYLAGKVAPVFDTAMIHVENDNRTKNPTLARHVCYWILRQHGWSFPRIAEASGRDHSGVFHGVKRIDEIEKGANNGSSEIARKVRRLFFATERTVDDYENVHSKTK